MQTLCQKEALYVVVCCNGYNQENKFDKIPFSIPFSPRAFSPSNLPRLTAIHFCRWTNVSFHMPPPCKEDDEDLASAGVIVQGSFPGIKFQFEGAMWHNISEKSQCMPSGS
jgi:hypothetical protein